MKIAITGSTGQLGKLVIEKLKEKVAIDQIVALARNTQKAESLEVEVREADYNDPNTFERALVGIDTLLLISSSELGKRSEQHGHVIAAAKKAGVSWIIYTSVLHADVSTLSLAAEHLATEAMIKESGIAYTLLRNGWYTENYINAIKTSLTSGAILGSANEGKISSASRVDYAEAAVAVLTTEGHGGKTYELAGDFHYTLSDLAAEISKQTGETITYKNLSEADYASTLTSFGLPDELAKSIAGWDTAISEGALFDEERQLSSLIGTPTIPLATVVEEALKD